MKPLMVLGVFLIIMAGHFLYVTRDISTSNEKGQWASFALDQPKESRLARYINPGEYWLGLSYGVAGAFAAFSLIQLIRRRRESLATSGRGLLLGSVLWVSVCFFIGCCGSPMLPVYLGLLGPKFLGITKPLTFALTILSLFVGYRWMLRRAKPCECDECQH